MQWFPSLTMSAMETIALTFIVGIVGFWRVEGIIYIVGFDFKSLLEGK